MNTENIRSAIEDGAHKSKAPHCLKHFDDLPGSANVRLPIVMALFGCSAPTIYRMVARGQLEKPIKLGPKISAWNVSALRRALAEFARR